MGLGMGGLRRSSIRGVTFGRTGRHQRLFREGLKGGRMNNGGEDQSIGLSLFADVVIRSR